MGRFPPDLTFAFARAGCDGLSTLSAAGQVMLGGGGVGNSQHKRRWVSSPTRLSPTSTLERPVFGSDDRPTRGARVICVDDVLTLMWKVRLGCVGRFWGGGWRPDLDAWAAWVQSETVNLGGEMKPGDPFLFLFWHSSAQGAPVIGLPHQRSWHLWSSEGRRSV